MAAMARRCSTFAGCLVLTIANTFLAVYIVKRLARHEPKREESGHLSEKESDCATRVENVQVQVTEAIEEQKEREEAVQKRKSSEEYYTSKHL